MSDRLNIADLKNGKGKQVCPVCGPTRKNKKDPSVWYSKSNDSYTCMNCGAYCYGSDKGTMVKSTTFKEGWRR